MYKILKSYDNLSVDKDFRVEIPDTEKIGIESENEDNETACEEEISAEELAKIEADRLIEETNEYCKRLINQAKQESEAIRSEARMHGYEQAFAEQLSSIMECIEKTNNSLVKINSEHKSFMSEYTRKLPEFALEIASAVMKVKLEEDPLVMCDLVENVMSEIRETSWALVTLSKELVPLIELLQSELPAKCPTINSLEIRGVDIEKGKCFVDSAGGIVDASISEQIANLARRFEQISQKRG